MPKKRLTMSRIRRLPACGSARFTSNTASRRGSALAPLGRAGGRTGRAVSAARPPTRYFLAHSHSVVYGTPSFSDTRATGSFPSTTIAAADTITSNGHARRGACPAPSCSLELP
jgi:hypothetical protein